MPKVNWTEANIEDLTGKVIIVTGATSGIGKAAATAIARKNATVVLAVRNCSKGLTVKKEIDAIAKSGETVVMDLDLSKQASVKAFAESFTQKYHRLDVLINNAGIMMCPYSKTEDGFEIQIGTNHFGHFTLTGLLLPLLKATSDSRVVNVSSGGHIIGNLDFDDLEWEKRRYNTQRAYGDSKLANLYFTYELGRRFKKHDLNIKVAAVHPGWTATGLQSHMPMMLFLNRFFSQPPEMGCLPTLRAAFGVDTNTGDYFGPDNLMQTKGYPVKMQSNKRSKDIETAKKFFEISEKRTGVSFEF